MAAPPNPVMLLRPLGVFAVIHEDQMYIERYMDPDRSARVLSKRGFATVMPPFLEVRPFSARPRRRRTGPVALIRGARSGATGILIESAARPYAKRSIH